MFNTRNNGGKGRAVSFYSDDVIADLELDANESAVPLSRLCETLELDTQAELQRIQSHPVLQAGLSSLPIDIGNRREMQPCLRVDLVPLWLVGVALDEVGSAMRPKLELYQRECASVLWQTFKPQGFSPEDALVPGTHDMSPAEHAYQSQMGMAVLGRHQMMIERQLNDDRSDYGQPREPVVDQFAGQLARAVRVVASALSTRSRRNEYGGVYQGLYRQFGVTSYRNIPRGRFIEAMEWLDRWRGDIEGEPEPPPDI